MDFSSYFEDAVIHLTEIGRLPECEWDKWEFLKPKVADRGDFCTFTILRTVMRLNKCTGSEYKSDEWCEFLLESLPDIPGVLLIYSENGIINIRLDKLDDQLIPQSSLLNFEPIGFIRSCFSEKFGTPRQSNF